VWKATELEPARRVEFLANRRIIAGAVNYMLGPEGIGKSLFLVWLVAHVTTGRPFPEFGIPTRSPGRVVLVLTEDDWATIVRPRLELAGADLAYVEVICAEKDGSGSPTFPEHWPVIEQAAPGAALIVVDAWADTLPTGLSVRDPQQARQALHPWKELATRTSVAVLLNGHTNRDKSGNARDAYGLTGELRKKARSTLLGQPDPDDAEVLVIGPEKSNVTAAVPASRFRIEAVQVFPPTDDSDGTVPRLVWLGDAEQSARDLFADAAATDEVRSERDEVAAWLLDFLVNNGGQAPALDVFKAGQAEGYSRDALKRAKGSRVRSEKAGFGSGWVWRVVPSEDEESTKGAKRAPSRNAPSSLSSPLPSSQPRGRGPLRVVDAPVLTCRVCGGPLDPVLGDDIHPSCEDAS
jgi:hypothetical protein